MRFRLPAALAAAAALVLSAPAAHADNFTGKDASLTTQTFCSKLVSGLQYPCHLLYGLFGTTPTALAVDASGNAGVNVQSSVLPTNAASASNQGSQIAQETAISTALGTQSSTWSGTGDGPLIGIDKSIYAKIEAVRALLAGTITVTGNVGVTGTLPPFASPPAVIPNTASPSSGTITAADVASTTTTGQSGVVLVNGSPTANSFQAQAVAGYSSGTVTVTGTFVATLAVEASYDGGTNWAPVSGLLRGTNVTVASITGPAVVSLDLTGVTNVRLRASAYTSGTPTAKFSFSAASGMAKVLNGVKLVDSGGGDATDTTNHSSKVTCVVGCSSTAPWTSSGQAAVTVSAGTSSSSTALTSPGAVLVVTNDGPGVIGARVSSGSSTALLTDTRILPGQYALFATPGSSPNIDLISSLASTSVRVESGAGAYQSGLSVDTGKSSAIAGDVAAGATDSGNSVKTGGLAKTADPTAVTDAQRVDDLHDVLGKRVSIPALRGQKAKQFTTITSSASETTIATAGGASVFVDVYAILATNTSASDGSCTIKDATSGSTVGVVAVKGGTTGGMWGDAGSAIPQASSNNNWTATCTSLASWNITVVFVKTKA